MSDPLARVKAVLRRHVFQKMSCAQLIEACEDPAVRFQPTPALQALMIKRGSYIGASQVGVGSCRRLGVAMPCGGSVWGGIRRDLRSCARANYPMQSFGKQPRPRAHPCRLLRPPMGPQGAAHHWGAIGLEV